VRSKAGPHQLLAVNNQPAITNKRFIFIYFKKAKTFDVAP
jgi:hypothetical protein